MSAENVDVVRAQFAATNDRDFPRAMEYYADDVVLIVAPDASLESGTFEGREAVGRWFGAWFATFEANYRFEIVEIRDLGDAVLFVADQEAHGRTSGAYVRAQMGYLYTVRDAKIVRAELYRGRSEAFKAAGLSV